MTTEVADRYAAAEAAADRFVELFDREFRKDDADPDALADALQLVVEVLAVVAPRSSCEAVVVVVETALRRYGERHRAEPEASRAEAHGQMPHICAALDRALARFDRQSELEAATAEVADLDQQYHQTIAALERAVADADVPTVMKLRGDAEVGLPGRLGAARIRLLELQIAQAEAQRSKAPERTRAFAEAVDRAKEEHEEAVRQVERARAAFYGAGHRRDTAKRLAAEAEARGVRLRVEHEALVASHEQDQQRRLRRLAGLPELQEVS